MKSHLGTVHELTAHYHTFMKCVRVHEFLDMKPGPRPYLEQSEEIELVSFIEQCASIGYGKSRKDIMCIAQSAVESKGLLRKDVISNGWWRRFIERHNRLSLRKGDSTAYVRMDAVNEETLTEYFDLLEDTLK